MDETRSGERHCRVEKGNDVDEVDIHSLWMLLLIAGSKVDLLLVVSDSSDFADKS